MHRQNGAIARYASAWIGHGAPVGACVCCLYIDQLEETGANELGGVAPILHPQVLGENSFPVKRTLRCDIAPVALVVLTPFFIGSIIFRHHFFNGKSVGLVGSVLLPLIGQSPWP